jgi:hypothetical protein
MTSTFEVTLDTQTQVGVAINGNNSTTESDIVTLELAFEEDVIEVKIWGDINPLDPANSEFGETEETAPWIPVSPSFLVHLTTSEGQKRLNARVKDDVWNEATGSDTIVLGEEVIIPGPPTPSQQPLPLPGRPEPRRVEAEEVVVRSSIRLRTRASVRTDSTVQGPGVRVRSGGAAVRVQTATDSDGFHISTRVRSYIRRDATDPAPASSTAPPPKGSARSSLTVGAETSARINRGDGPTIEALDALDLL